MSAYTLSFTSNQSELNAEYFPPIILNGDYECGLVDLQTFNSIPNIDKTNNLLHYGSTNAYITLPTGSYELEDINKCIRHLLMDKVDISITSNNNTLKCLINSSETINFDKENSIGSLLGFTKRKLRPHTQHESDLPVAILKINTIRIQCSIISNAYIDNEQVHTIHEFFPNVAPGYKIMEVPKTVIYLPVSVTSIDNILIRIVDQNGDLIDFRGETISIRLHLKKC